MSLDIYRGFSSKGVKNGFDTSISGINLVKQDLQNHFETEQYECVGRPLHYSIIPNLLFQKDDRTKMLAKLDAERIFRSDPRVSLLELDIQQSDHRVFVIAKLRFEQFNMDDYFIVTLGDNR